MPPDQQSTQNMIFTIAVHGYETSSPAALSGVRFARALLNQSHTIHRVFFYHDGVLNAQSLMVTPQEQSSVRDQWVALHDEHGFELSVCIAAALKRGVLNETERARYEMSACSIHPAFDVVGLGQLVEAAMVSDRLVTFGA